MYEKHNSFLFFLKKFKLNALLCFFLNWFLPRDGLALLPVVVASLQLQGSSPVPKAMGIALLRPCPASSCSCFATTTGKQPVGKPRGLGQLYMPQGHRGASKKHSFLGNFIKHIILLAKHPIRAKKQATSAHDSFFFLGCISIK